MADKQIIIDGVDVSGCECYNPNIKMDCLLYPLQSDACKNNPNCHYKLYKRKEQECEFWEKELDRTHLLMLEKQDELVKEILKNDQLEAEKKELKTCYNNNLKVLRHEEKVNNNLTDRVMKAEQALQEIKEIANKNEVCPYVISHHCDKYDCKRKEHCEIAQILQKCEVIKDE